MHKHACIYAYPIALSKYPCSVKVQFTACCKRHCLLIFISVELWIRGGHPFLFQHFYFELIVLFHVLLLMFAVVLRKAMTITLQQNLNYSFRVSDSINAWLRNLRTCWIPARQSPQISFLLLRKTNQTFHTGSKFVYCSISTLFQTFWSKTVAFFKCDSRKTRGELGYAMPSQRL